MWALLIDSPRNSMPNCRRENLVALSRKGAKAIEGRGNRILLNQPPIPVKHSAQL